MKTKHLTINALTVIAFLLPLVFTAIAADKPTIGRIEPPFWWAGFKNPSLQLMVHGDRISETKPEIVYEGVELVSFTAVKNTNYLFLDLRLSPTVKPGKFDILFKQNGKTVISSPYVLKKRDEGSSQRAGFNSSDVLYLIMPDRFANGDPSNDSKADELEKSNRADPNGLHGGDLKGIQDHLDYIKENGYSAIWVNPLLENNMAEYSYHGYSTTDFYKVDNRFGSNDDYRQLSAEAKKRGIKMVMDMIFNHCGSNHWWMRDMPMEDWINGYPHYLKWKKTTDKSNPNFITGHQKWTIQDPYASEVDSRSMTEGWFDTSMPDLNQRNPYLATYLIQNSIWWIENVGLGGIRMDTYPYPDKQMMADWAHKVMEEYPNFNIVGESWNTNAAEVAFWQKGKANPNGYTSNLPSLMDFPLRDALVRSMNDNTGNNDTSGVDNISGLDLLYTTLSLDFLYPKANNLVIFADNHDTKRFFSSIGEDLSKFKTAMTFLMTTRGIPQVYYGGEILMTGLKSQGDGNLRKDFPGGWQGDKKNGFTGAGLTTSQLDAQQFMKKLVNWRKGKEVVHNGKLKHYCPRDNFYVYFRYDEKETVMVVLNLNTKDTVLNTERFAESLKGFTAAKEVLSGRSLNDLKNIAIPAKTSMVLELLK